MQERFKDLGYLLCGKIGAPVFGDHRVVEGGGRRGRVFDEEIEDVDAAAESGEEGVAVEGEEGGDVFVGTGEEGVDRKGVYGRHGGGWRCGKQMCEEEERGGGEKYWRARYRPACARS